MRIGVFDSGIGGLTVLAEAMAQIHGADFLYFADTESVPYGNKQRDRVRECVFTGVEFMARQGIEALVVACNTATSVAIEDLRRTYAFPIIGMEPAVKPALLLSEQADSRVLVLATDMTLREEKFQRLVNRIDHEARVDYLSLQQLVTWAEAFEFSAGTVAPYLEQRTSRLDIHAYGTVVLGCTHFPYFRPHLARLFGAEVQLVDGNRGTVNNLCAHLGALLPEGGTNSLTCFESCVPCAPGRFQRYLDYFASI